MHGKWVTRSMKSLVKNISQILIKGMGCVVIAVLFCLKPFCSIKIGNIYFHRLGHLALNTDLFLRRLQSGEIPDKHFYIFISGKPCNQQLLKMFKIHLRIVENDFLFKMWQICMPLFQKTAFFQDLPMRSNEYPVYQDSHKVLTFTPEEELRGQSYLRKLGIGEKDWFVSLFVRDNAYLSTMFPEKDWRYHDSRNADIDSYTAACQYISQQGGYVIRLGSVVQKKIDLGDPKIIDYSVSEDQCAFLDIYLSAKARFHLGTTSGMSDVAIIFDVPRIGTNFMPVGHIPWGKTNVYIPKIIRQKETQKIIPYRFFLKDKREREYLNSWKFAEQNISPENNSSEDILDVTQEMMARLDGTFEFSDADRELLDKYFQLFEPGNWSYGIGTPIGLKFLKKYPEMFSYELELKNA